MKLLDTVKNIISEKLGVPDNIAEAGELLYNKIMALIPNSIHIDDLVDEKFKIPVNIKIADMPIKEFNIGFQFEEYSENTLAAVQHHSDSEYTDDFKIETNASDEIKIVFILLGDKDMLGKDVKDILSNDKNKMMGILTHEIKHHYDSFKNKYENLKTRVDYSAKSNVKVGNILPINQFIIDTYYVHNIENLVRPSELYSNIKSGEVTKSGFYKFFTEHKIFETLKRIKELTFNKFITILKNDINEIKDALDKNYIDYRGLSDDEIINKLLEITVVNLFNFKGEAMQGILTTGFMESIFGLKGKKKKFFEDYLKTIQLDMDNPENFFKSEIKKMNYLADKMIKKLSKLYDMTKSDGESNITEITLVHDEVSLPTDKINTDLKFLPLKKRHPVKIKTKRPSN